MKENEADIQNRYTTCTLPNDFSVAFQETTFTLCILHALGSSACGTT